MQHARVELAIVALGISGCAAFGTMATEGPITGAWGGVHAGLTLTGTGGTIQYDCAHGGLGAAVTTDTDGNFDVAGVHIRETGGPVRIDAVPDSLPARYVGQVHDDRMTLRVLVGADTLGPFELKLGAAPQLFRCL